MRGSLLGPPSRVQDRLGSRPMSVRTRGRAQRFEHRRPHHGMGELEWVLVAEEVSPNQRARRRQRRRRVRPGEGGGESEVGAIAKDRRRTQQIGRFCRQTAEARRHAVRDCPRTQLEDVRRVLDRRCEPLLQHRVEQRNQVERVASRTRLEGGSERRRRLLPEPFACERGGGLTAENGGPDNDRDGIRE